MLLFIALSPGEHCGGNTFGYVCLSVCLSERNSKTIAPIHMIFKNCVSRYDDTCMIALFVYALRSCLCLCVCVYVCVRQHWCACVRVYNSKTL